MRHTFRDSKGKFISKKQVYTTAFTKYVDLYEESYLYNELPPTYVGRLTVEQAKKYMSNGGSFIQQPVK